MIKIGLSGLLATQKALATTANNISNAATEGYSRQRVESSARASVFFGGSFVGTGVEMGQIQRAYDAFLAAEVRSGLSSSAHLESFLGLATRLGDAIGSPAAGLSASLQSFRSALESVAQDPASVPLRQVAVTEAEGLTRRFNGLNAQLNSLAQETQARLRAAVAEVNDLADALAAVNQQLATRQSRTELPGDLLDQRDRLLDRLAGQIEVRIIEQSDGTVAVATGNGQALVTGATVRRLSLGPGEFGAAGSELRLGNTAIGSRVGGGVIAGLLAFEREVLEPTRSELGRVALGLAASINQTSREGMDLLGARGTDWFGFAGPEVFAGTGNAPGSALSVSLSALEGLRAADYRLDFDGDEFTLLDLAQGQTVALSEADQTALRNGEPVIIDGLRFQFGSAPSAGDRFLIRPSAGVAGSLTTLLSSPARLAAAVPVRTDASADNSGSASIRFDGLDDAQNPDLLQTVTLRFIDPENFEILDSAGSLLAGPLVYSPTEAIAFNGWRVRLAGEPAAGDTFTLQTNAGAVGDNRNVQGMLGAFEFAMAGADGGTLLDRVDGLTGRLGSTAASASTALVAQRSGLALSRSALESVRGVNLEEEAANLLRLQQAYEANAQVIRIADNLFQTLLGAMR